MAISSVVVDPTRYQPDIDCSVALVKGGATPRRRVVLSHDPESIWYYPSEAIASITVTVGPTTWWKYTSPQTWDLPSQSIALSLLDLEATGPSASDAAQERLCRQVRDSIIETPVEDGVSHPVEDILRAIVAMRPLEAPQWIHALVVGDAGSAIRADILVCLGRLPQGLTDPWGPEVARWALTSPEIALRHAAVRALELWGGERSIGVLEAHREPEPWLTDYVTRVVRDLRESHPAAASDTRAFGG